MLTNGSSRRSRQRDQLILALLQHSSLQKAAASIGMSATTAWRISKTSEFEEEYRAARREAYSQTIARLQFASSAAASLILKLLSPPPKIKAIHLRAAVTVLEQSWKAMHIEDLAARLARLEQAIKK
jgi:hypothetical protein